MQQQNLLICLSGSVASIKLPDLLQVFQNDFNIRLVFTQKSLFFIDINEIKKQYQDIKIFLDQDEWQWQKIGDSILHIDLRNWADILLISPLSANTLAKISNGFCDNLLTCIFRAWDFKKKVFVAPAMNTQMYNNILTQKQFEILLQLGVIIIDSIEKKLACGDIGKGAMAEVANIHQTIIKYKL